MINNLNQFRGSNYISRAEIKTHEELSSSASCWHRYLTILKVDFLVNEDCHEKIFFSKVFFHINLHIFIIHESQLASFIQKHVTHTLPVISFSRIFKLNSNSGARSQEFSGWHRTSLPGLILELFKSFACLSHREWKSKRRSTLGG